MSEDITVATDEPNQQPEQERSAEETQVEPTSITITAEAVLQLPEDKQAVDYIDLFQTVIGKHSNDKKWATGRLSGIKTLSNTKVGQAGQDFIEELCNSIGIPIIFPTGKTNKRLNQNPWDIKLHEITFELKTATEDTSCNFQFNHIRYHRKYEALLCLGVSPDELYFNIYSKSDVLMGKAGNLVTMEKGANASYKLTKTKGALHKIDVFEEKLKEFIASFVK